MEPRILSSDDFLYGHLLGEGRFGTVIYAEPKPAASASSASVADHDAETSCAPQHQYDRQHQQTGYAIKMITKTEVLRHNQIQAVMAEKHILAEILSKDDWSELFMKLFVCFNDANYLYFVLELCAGGTLFDLIQSRTSDIADGTLPVMELSWVRYYAGQILRAIEYLHQRGVVHRDLSPQNIGITFPQGNIKLGDFGSAVVFVKEEHAGTVRLKRWTSGGTTPGNSEEQEVATGTADYVSPEMLRGNDINGIDCVNYPAIDLWSFGCIIYHMMVGKSPFHAASDHFALEAILDYSNGKSEVDFPECTTGDAKDLISSLLVANPTRRVGMQDGVIESMRSCNIQVLSPQKQYISIREHSFFQIDKADSFWTLLENKSTRPPYTPTKPDWMTELQQGRTTLKQLDDVCFDV